MESYYMGCFSTQSAISPRCVQDLWRSCEDPRIQMTKGSGYGVEKM